MVSHGWHAGLIVPASELNQLVPELGLRFGNVPYYELGWGDKGFYQSQEITTGLTLQGMFWSEGAVMHLVAVPHAPKAVPGNSNLCLTLFGVQSWGSDQ